MVKMSAWRSGVKHLGLIFKLNGPCPSFESNWSEVSRLVNSRRQPLIGLYLGALYL